MSNLVSTEWLAAHLNDVRVVDASWYMPNDKRDPHAEFEAAHIPGAVHFDIDAIADRSTDLIYHDEFGSLSSNSEWVPKEMFKRAMHDLHPQDEDIESAFVFTSGPRLPAAPCDVVIDMRDLRRLRAVD